MKTIRFTEEIGGIEAWRVWRLAKITGSRAKDIGLSKTGIPKIGNYALIAESWIGSAALAEDDESTESAMNRGTRLEKEAIARFVKETGKKVDDSLIGWERDDDPRIAISPDGFIGKIAGVEAKCLSAARHIEAFITRQIPKEYQEQKKQYFVVSNIRSLFFVFYDPRFPAGLDFFYIEVKRKDIKEEIETALQEQRDTLKWVREQTSALTQYVKYPTLVVEEEILDIIKETQSDTLATMSDLDRIAAGIKERSL